MSPIFGHGRLRLYLLKLLDESPRHGYDVIRLLEDRFLGVYAPSAGTIYPRLARLEEEGLVTHSEEGGRKVYRLTDAGREELRQRQGELEDLEQEIAGSVRDLAREVKEDVRESVRSLREELKQATRDIRADTREESREAWRAWHDVREAWRDSQRAWREEWREEWREAWDEAWEGRRDGDRGEGRDKASRDAASRDARRELERLVQRFRDETHEAVRHGDVDDTALHACRVILDDAMRAMRAALGTHRDDSGGR